MQRGNSRQKNARVVVLGGELSPNRHVTWALMHGSLDDQGWSSALAW